MHLLEPVLSLLLAVVSVNAAAIADANPNANANTNPVPDVAELTNNNITAREPICFFQAYSGHNCDGSAGSNLRVYTTPTCINLSGRWSYKLPESCKDTKLRTESWTSTSCGGTRRSLIDGRGGKCYPIPSDVYSMKVWNRA